MFAWFGMWHEFAEPCTERSLLSIQFCFGTKHQPFQSHLAGCEIPNQLLLFFVKHRYFSRNKPEENAKIYNLHGSWRKNELS